MVQQFGYDTPCAWSRVENMDITWRLVRYAVLLGTCRFGETLTTSKPAIFRSSTVMFECLNNQNQLFLVAT